ncbi:hypothetical protein DXU03_08240 [Rhizobium johnstonii]
MFHFPSFIGTLCEAGAITLNSDREYFVALGYLSNLVFHEHDLVRYIIMRASRQFQKLAWWRAPAS